MKRVTIIFSAVLFTFMLCLTQTAMANDKCLDYATPLATSAKLLAKSIAATTEALVAVNERANANEITSFNDFVASAQERSEQMVRDLNEKQQRIMERAESSKDYTLCKEDMQDELDELKELSAQAKDLLVELKDSIKDMLSELKGAFFG
ncbi:hypothetical protein [Halodesulfovibrio spirochaetisodalis]|uniref:Uncharacterized protein n=1 Tax=Halodesulfovibrio spirochaetisodalis TaxID=1560234 RepID=A0A1B7XFL9_9BACT|nr:hypothetical protein [Halodesulfovibrio spirochaetisodalis]OBQ54048.1 hypothetical protein SP90_06110 [Halodesulfovibrio spirochaetisodalis]